MMDPGQIISEIGGGLAAVVIVALAIANIIQYRRNNALQDLLLNTVLTMGKENRDLLAATNATIAANTEAIKQVMLEARR